MRAREFIVENYSTNLPVQDIKHVLGIIKDEAEDVDDASMRYKNQDDPDYKELENDYHALTAISYVLNNNLKAHKLAQENPTIFDTNIFMYDVEPDDVLGGVAAIHVKLDNNVAEIKWLGSYRASGGKLMKAALDVAKSRGATSVKVDAKWNSEGFYRKMGLDQDTNAEPDTGEALRGSKLTPFIGRLSEDEQLGRVTASTVVTPSTVKQALAIMNKFFKNFNVWLKKRGMEPVEMGPPTGSSAYYQVDPEDKIYGDIDLQVIVPDVPELEGKTPSQIQKYWNQYFDEFAKTQNYVHPTSVPGRPIIQIGPDQWLKIDLMPNARSVSKWGRYRVTPERGVKGLLQGNIFLTLGLLLNLNRGELGIQYKERGGKRLPYAKTLKNYDLKTVSTNIETFIRDIFDHEYTLITGRDPKTAKIDPLLDSFPGMKIDEIKVSNLVNGIKGLARSFALNNMYGKGTLEKFTSYEDFINEFIKVYDAKAHEATDAPKRHREETPEVKAKGEADRKAIISGLEKIKAIFK